MVTGRSNSPATQRSISLPVVRGCVWHRLRHSLRRHKVPRARAKATPQVYPPMARLPYMHLRALLPPPHHPTRVASRRVGSRSGRESQIDSKPDPPARVRVEGETFKRAFVRKCVARNAPAGPVVVVNSTVRPGTCFQDCKAETHGTFGPRMT